MVKVKWNPKNRGLIKDEILIAKVASVCSQPFSFAQKLKHFIAVATLIATYTLINAYLS